MLIGSIVADVDGRTGVLLAVSMRRPCCGSTRTFDITIFTGIGWIADLTGVGLFLSDKANEADIAAGAGVW